MSNHAATSVKNRSCSGFTLVEVIVAMGIMAVLLVAVQSTILLASHSIPSAKSKATALTTASTALDALNADLALATAIISRSATQVSFQVPDRTGDGVAETITWSWSGRAGDPLTRTFNGRAVNMAAGVQSFSLLFDSRSVTAPTTYAAGAETLLSSNDGTSFTQDNNIDTNSFTGQYFLPSLPANAVSWSITRVQLKARYHGNTNDSAWVQLQSVNSSNLPSGGVIDQALLLESTLGSSYAWTQFNFSNATGLAPGCGMAIVVSGNSSNACYIQSQIMVSALTNANLLQSWDGGSHWTASVWGDLNYYVYGTVTTPNPAITLYYLTGARATLNLSNDSQATARTTVRIFNEPQVATP